MKNLNCIGCGATSVMVEFEQRSMQVAYKGLAQVLDGLAGWSCRQCGEIEFSASSAMRYALCVCR